MKNNNSDLFFISLTDYLNLKQIIILQHLINKNNLSIPEYIDTSKLKSLKDAFILSLFGIDRLVFKDIALGIFKIFVLISIPIYSIIFHVYFLRYFDAIYWFTVGCVSMFWIYDVLSIKRRTLEYNFRTILDILFSNTKSDTNQSTTKSHDNDFNCILSTKYKYYFDTKNVAIIKLLNTYYPVVNSLRNPRGMFFTSLFLGLFGVDRFLIKQSILGGFKLAILLLANILSLIFYFYIEKQDIDFGVITVFACICATYFGVLFMFWLLDLCTVINRTQHYNFMTVCESLNLTRDNTTLIQSSSKVSETETSDMIDRKLQ